MTKHNYPHRRYNALTGDWILVSPQRTQRPWQGNTEHLPPAELPQYDPNCYLCPGNIRANGNRNPQYTDTYVFTNDFPALLPDAPLDADPPSALFKAEGVRGTSRVVCFSPRHDLTLGQLPQRAIRNVIDTWAAETAELGKLYRWVQLFENKGAVMGCSNPHPHGQFWTGTALPTEARKEDDAQETYLKKHNSVLLLDYLREELQRGERIVAENTHWTCIVPYWAVWPFEVLLVPRRHVLRLPDLTDDERTALATVLKTVLNKFDNIFSVSFPYTMGWHGAPFHDAPAGHWQLHAHIYPPLLRSATVKKFMVGYEMLAEPQRDITPESSAELLRNLPDVPHSTHS